MGDPIPQSCESLDVNDSTDVPLVDCAEFSGMSDNIEFLFLDTSDGRLKRVELGCLINQGIGQVGNRGTYRNYEDASNDGVSPGDEWLTAKHNDLGMPEGAVIVQPGGQVGNRGIYLNYADASNNGIVPGDEWLTAKTNDLGAPEGLLIVQPAGY